MKIFIAFLLILSLFSDGLNAQNTTTNSTTESTTVTTSSTTESTTTDSTTTLPTTTTSSPTPGVAINVTWIFSSEINVTNVTMNIENLGSSQWAAIGLGQNQAMVNIKE